MLNAENIPPDLAVVVTRQSAAPTLVSSRRVYQVDLQNQFFFVVAVLLLLISAEFDKVILERTLSATLLG